VNDTGR